MQNVQTTYTNFFIFVLLVAAMIALGFVYSEYIHTSEIVAEVTLEKDIQDEINDSLFVTVEDQDQIIRNLNSALDNANEQLQSKSEEANAANLELQRLQLELALKDEVCGLGEQDTTRTTASTQQQSENTAHGNPAPQSTSILADLGYGWVTPLSVIASFIAGLFGRNQKFRRPEKQRDDTVDLTLTRKQMQEFVQWQRSRKIAK